MFKVLQNPRPMKTKKAMRDRTNWALVQTGGDFGLPTSKYQICPICLEYHKEHNVCPECLDGKNVPPSIGSRDDGYTCKTCGATYI